MTYRSWNRRVTIPNIGSVSVEQYLLNSDNSPKVRGKLMLRGNMLSLEHNKNLHYSYDGKGATVPSPFQAAGSSTQANQAYSAAYATAYARFRGKLYKGSAALGVTAASYRQSREMIVKNSEALIRNIAQLDRRIARRYVNRRLPKRAADKYLEVVFGWKPLLEDIRASCFTVIQQAARLESVNGRGNSAYYSFQDIVSPDGTRRTTTARGGVAKSTISTLVAVSNPNLWLMERAGLVNVGAVAWDLVPWSFVANMFSNVGGLVNSITDFVGLSFSNQTVTRTFTEGGTSSTSYHYDWTWPSPGSIDSSATSSWTARRKLREVGDIPRPSLIVKLPEANWELAAIASSLMVQQVYRLGRWF